jgi:hypothetical protein
MDSLPVPIGIGESNQSTRSASAEAAAEQSRLRQAMRIYPTRSKSKLLLPLVLRGRILPVRSAAARAS